MHEPSKLDSFGKDRAKNYDQSNSFMTPIYENLHYMITVVLNEMVNNSKILCIGVGTGTEIIKLAAAFPQFTFVAVEPSESMLEVCRERLQSLNLLARCQLVHGFIQDIPEKDDFDAALCLLVLHHTSKDGEGRRNIVSGIAKRLKPTGYFINAEISYDLSCNTVDDILEKWKSMSRRAGTSEEKIQSLPRLMKEHLSILPPSEVESLLVTNGFKMPIQFFQSLLIRAWYSQK